MLFSLTPTCVYPGCLIHVNRMTSRFNKSVKRDELEDFMRSCLPNSQLTEVHTPAKVSTAAGALHVVLHV